MLSARAKRNALFSALACIAVATPVAHAQKGDPAASFPSRPIRIVVPFTPGGQPDIFSRMIGQKAGEALGQQIVVDNRPAAGGMIGSQNVAEAHPGGPTTPPHFAAHVIAAP